MLTLLLLANVILFLLVSLRACICLKLHPVKRTVVMSIRTSNVAETIDLDITDRDYI